MREVERDQKKERWRRKIEGETDAEREKRKDRDSDRDLRRDHNIFLTAEDKWENGVSNAAANAQSSFS